MSDEKYLLLPGDSDHTKHGRSVETESRPRRYQDRMRRNLSLSVALNVIFFLVTIVLSAAIVLLYSQSNSAHVPMKKESLSEPYSPANAVIEYEYRKIKTNDTIFVGEPGPQWEEAMHELMSGTLLRVSEDELQLYGSNSLPLKDGGYAAGLGVAHNLHCIRKIKKWLYREQFYPELVNGDANFKEIRHHADHCLDYLRQGIMCHLDHSLYTLYWGKRTDIPTHNEPGVQKCVNWEKLHQWMISRAARKDMLVGPLD